MLSSASAAKLGEPSGQVLPSMGEPVLPSMGDVSWEEVGVRVGEPE